MASKNNQIVAKDNNLIEARYRLSVQEQRLIAIMVSDIKPTDRDFKDYVYKVEDITKWIQTEGKDYYRELRKVTARLLTRVISIKERKRLIQTSWLSSAEYLEDKGIVKLCFDPKLKPYLLQLKNCFTTYALKNILELRSKYAFRIYELCKQYQPIGKRKFHLDKLREILGLEKDELVKWSHFKEKVLLIAQREINKHTDIKIRYKFEKLGRKIEYITIYIINRNIADEIEDNEDKIRYTELIRLVRKEYQDKKTIQSAIIKYLKKKGFEYVKRNILYSNEKSEKNYRSFLIQSLKQDWALLWWEEQEELKQKELEKKEREREKQEEEERIQKLKNKLLEEAKLIFKNMPEDLKKAEIENIKARNIVKNEEIIKKIIIGNIYKKILHKEFTLGNIEQKLYKSLKN